MVEVVAALFTFAFTTALTIAGVGAAFILIPVFDGLGIPLREAMSTALLLNCTAMIFASYRYIKKGLVEFRTALPILVVAAGFSPLGAYSARFVPDVPLRWLFVGFLFFAAFMMLFYRPKAGGDTERTSTLRLLISGCVAGSTAGYVGGLLGVGGGNIIVPILVWMGFNPKKASATTAFIVIFSSFTGFLGHATVGDVNAPLLAATAVGSVAGALLGAYLMTEKLNRRQVKLVIGVILFCIATAMAWKTMHLRGKAGGKQEAPSKKREQKRVEAEAFESRLATRMPAKKPKNSWSRARLEARNPREPMRRPIERGGKKEILSAGKR